MKNRLEYVYDVDCSLAGFEPFKSVFETETYKRVLNCHLVFDDHYWNNITENAKVSQFIFVVLPVHTWLESKREP